MNPTMKKFGYPENLIKDYEHWVVLLRPQQVTLGALVLICKENANTFSEISTDAFLELKEVTCAIETFLKNCFNYDKINYLMLMMVDPDVHFHVLPRYAQNRTFCEMDFFDAGWPGPPDLSRINLADSAIRQKILHTFKCGFS